MAIDGSDVRRLTNNPADDVEPSYSPNGTRIAFRSDRSGNSQIYTMNPDGSGVTRITTSAPAGLLALVVSGRDEDRLLLQTDRRLEVFTMNANGSS